MSNYYNIQTKKNTLYIKSWSKIKQALKISNHFIKYYLIVLNKEKRKKMNSYLMVNKLMNLLIC